MIVSRIPAENQTKLPKVWDTRNEGSVNKSRSGAANATTAANVLGEAANITNDPNACEDDKIDVIIRASTMDYDPSK